jgi:FkbM family methyltransferase
MLKFLKEGLGWRWRLFRNVQYLKSHFRNGEELATSYVQNTPCDTAILKDGRTFRHPPGQTGFARLILEVWKDQVYTGRFYRPKNGHVVIDAGANVGVFSALLSMLSPECKVLAFEPFPDNFAYLKSNLENFAPNRVEAYCAALSKESGQAEMTSVSDRSQDHRLKQPGGHPSEKRGAEVTVLSFQNVLDAANSPVIQLFKCDIEGSEFDLLEDASSEQLGMVERFAIEYHDNLRPGTSDFLRSKLSGTHQVHIVAAPGNLYGMMYAVRK